jgi:hypothetical protein
MMVATNHRRLRSDSYRLLQPADCQPEINSRRRADLDGGHPFESIEAGGVSDDVIHAR